MLSRTCKKVRVAYLSYFNANANANNNANTNANANANINSITPAVDKLRYKYGIDIFENNGILLLLLLLLLPLLLILLLLLLLSIWPCQSNRRKAH